MAKPLCDCAYCRGVMDGAALAVRRTEVLTGMQSQNIRTAGVLSCGAFYVREARKLPPDQRVVLAQGLRTLLDKLSAGDPS